jgi:hypothetical protein
MSADNLLLSPQAPQVHHHVVLQGYLHKRRGGFGKFTLSAWQHRYFTVSSQGILKYFYEEDVDSTNISEDKPRGRIDLKSIEFDFVKDIIIEGGPTKYTMVIIPLHGEEKWKLCAETKEQHMQWCEIFEIYKHVNEPHSTPGQPYHGKFYASDDDDSVTISPIKDRKTSSSSSSEAFIESKLHYNHSMEDSKSLPENNQSNKNKKNKKTLKVGTAKSLFTTDFIETSMVVIIVNFCLYMIFQVDNMLYIGIYLCIANFVIYHSLNLRSSRLDKEIFDSATNLNLEIEKNKKLISKLTISPSSSTLVKEKDILKVEEPNENEIIKKNGKPIAGCTLKQVTTSPALSPDHTWCKVDHNQFQVRVGPDYNRNKLKAPSTRPLYEPFAVDFFCTSKRLDHVAQRFELPEALTELKTYHDSVPPIMIIQIQMPSDAPPSIFTSVEDGPGWAIVMYFKINEVILIIL